MTALAQPQTDRHDPLSAVRRRGSERGIFSIALGAALALHIAALLLPLPSRPAPPPVEPPQPPPDRVVWVTPIPPPELPELPVLAAAIPERILPIPMPEEQDQEPVAEPLPVSAIEPFGESFVELADFAAAPSPPQDLGPMPEGTPGLVLPRLISRCAEPHYPAMAVRVGMEGVVILRALITEHGDVTSIEIMRAPRPDFGFSESAITSLSCWKYEPGSYQGRAVAVSMTVIVEFELD
jgi:protein TonB